MRARGEVSAEAPAPADAAPERDPYVRLSKPRLGKTVRGKWRLDALLGVGGMAAVYAATHRNGSRVAIKMLHPLIATDEAKRRFLREGYLANSVEHPGVVRVLDDDEAEDGSIFLVMELLEGESLESFATRRVQVGAADTLAVAEQVLEVLGAAHDKGIVHRDVKPENIFLCADGRVKLLDFGIARLLEGSRGSAATHHGFLLGTPAYMAPEQARGDWELVDARTDVWAVGASMFRVLSGRTVHRGSTHLELLMKATREPAPRVRDVAPAVPELVASLVDRALAFSKHERWSSAPEMLESLREVHRALGFEGAPELRARPSPAADDDAPTQIAGMSLSRQEQLRSILIEMPNGDEPTHPAIFGETGEMSVIAAAWTRAPRPPKRGPLTRSVIIAWLIAAAALLVFFGALVLR